MRTKQNIIIDTDPGVDDAMALAMAFASHEIEIRLLSTVFGNARTAVTTRNAMGLLDLAGQHSIPVAPGAIRPLVSSYNGPIPHVQGHDGLGDGNLLDGVLPVAGPSLPANHAALKICEIARQIVARGQALTIVTLGPLTNLALALAIDPEIDAIVDRIVIMGGNVFCPGNATPTAEANMMNDPEAADAVLGARWPITMIGLDVTHKVNLGREQIDRIAASDTLGGMIARKALPLYQDYFERTNGIEGIFVHDPSVIAWLLAPDLFTTRPLPLRVETSGISRGKAWPSLGDTDDMSPLAWRERPIVDVAVEVKDKHVIELLVERLT